LSRRNCQLTPDLEPSAVLLVNTLTSDLNLDVLNQMVTNVIDPTERRTLALNLGQINLHVNAVNQIAVTRNERGHSLSEIGLSTKSLLNRLHGEVSVTAVDNLKEGDLWVTSQVNILGAIGDKLH